MIRSILVATILGTLHVEASTLPELSEKEWMHEEVILSDEKLLGEGASEFSVESKRYGGKPIRKAAGRISFRSFLPNKGPGVAELGKLRIRGCRSPALAVLVGPRDEAHFRRIAGLEVRVLTVN